MMNTRQQGRSMPLPSSTTMKAIINMRFNTCFVGFVQEKTWSFYFINTRLCKNNKMQSSFFTLQAKILVNYMYGLGKKKFLTYLA
jgi:hypothetical protein